MNNKFVSCFLGQMMHGVGLAGCCLLGLTTMVVTDKIYGTDAIHSRARDALFVRYNLFHGMPWVFNAAPFMATALATASYILSSCISDNAQAPADATCHTACLLPRRAPACSHSLCFRAEPALA